MSVLLVQKDWEVIMLLALAQRAYLFEKATEVPKIFAGLQLEDRI